MQELLLSKKQEKDRANQVELNVKTTLYLHCNLILDCCSNKTSIEVFVQQNMLEDLLKWKAQTEQSLKVILGSWKGMQVYE